MKSLGITALAALTVLAVPAVAAAHPSVYATNAKVVVNGALADQARYVVTNHGFTYVLRETNNVDGTNNELKTRGVVGYNLIPSAWRTGKTFNQVMSVGGTGAQAHATCLTPQLQTEAVIREWQGGPTADAFYNYVPFQATPAGLEDDATKWLPILTRLGVDTTKLADPATAAAECVKLTGEYVPADTIQTTFEALADGTVKEKTAPLSTQISTLQSQVTQLQNQVTTLQAAAAQVNAAPKPVRPLTLKLSAKKFAQGVAMVTGEPNTVVTVNALLSAADAKKLKIARTISSKKATIDAQGAALVDLGLTAKAAKAIDKHLPALKVTVEAAAGTAKQTATGSLTR